MFTEHESLVARVDDHGVIQLTGRLEMSEQTTEVVIDTLLPLCREGPDILEDDIIPSKIKIIDKYARKDLFGLELSQRLFWRGYVMEQDISRNEADKTGRPSTPGFQDANNKTLMKTYASGITKKTSVKATKTSKTIFKLC